MCQRVEFFSIVNDNYRKFKKNQIIFCMYARVVEDSRSIDFGEDRLRVRDSLPATVFFYQGKFFFFGKR